MKNTSQKGEYTRYDTSGKLVKKGNLSNNAILKTKALLMLTVL